ncbi:MAG: TetR/AcrR family transcriptional regulator [Candidatus Promineifilaceae bacterium]|nr:TetR/AcrR family transcriptional regulator [Candidatus Promineifilaceae bacterium]
MNKRTESSAARRRQILQATLAEFSEHGLNHMTIAAISARSGASVGSIYHHFGDREGVLYALYHQCFSTCFDELKQAVQSETSARAGMIALVTTYLGWIDAHPQHGRFMYEASGGDLLLHHRDQIVAFKGEFYAAIMQWMQPYIVSGEIIALPPWAYDVIIMGPAHEFARRWLGGLREMPMETAQTMIAEAIWRAVQAPPAASATTAR